MTEIRPANRPPRRVLHVVLDLHEGGLERVVTDLVLWADRTKTVPHVLCLRQRGQLAAELPSDAVTVAEPSGPAGLLYPRALARTLRLLAPEIVHLHSGTWYKAAYAARVAGLGPVLYTDHGRLPPDPLVSRMFDGLACSLTDQVIAVSEPLAGYLKDRVFVPARKVSVVPNGILLQPSASAAEVSALRVELGIEPGVSVVGTVGRLDSVKAHDYLLTAFAELLRGWPTIPRPVLLIAGDGPELQRIREHAAMEGLGDSVRFLGWRNDVRRLLDLLDVFVLPSDSEGTSISLLEAMGAGRAVVATAVGGTPDVLGQELSAQLVSPRDVTALAERIRTLLLDPRERQVAGRLAQERVAARYSVQSMVRAYDDLYDAL